MSRALALCLCLALFPTAAHAQQKLAVVPLAANPNLTGIADRLTGDIVEAARSEHYDVIDPAAVKAALGAEPLKKLYECNGGAGCVSSYAGKLGADRVVVGSLDRNETSYLVKLWLVDVKKPALISSVDRAILIASRRLNSDVKAAIPGFLEGKQEATARLSITSTPPGATVDLDGQVAGQTPLSATVKPGKHVLKLSKQSYLPVERFVDVEAGATRDVVLSLTPVPGTHPDEPVAAAKKPSGEAESTEGGSLNIPLGTYIAGGVALVAVGTGAFFGLQAKGIQDRAVDANGDGALDITRAEAQQGKRDAFIANASYVAAGVAAGAAVLFVFLAPSEPAKSVGPVSSSDVGIAFVKGGAAMTLGGRF